MNPDQFTAAVALACVLILLGVVPGLFEFVVESMERLETPWAPHLVRTRWGTMRTRHVQRPGLAIAGGLIILLSALAFFWR